MESQEGAQRQRHRRVADRDRKRAQRACDNCRRLKEKCDGGVPCRRCTRLNRQCDFSGSLKANGGGEGRQHSAPELEQRLGYLERILTHYAGNINLDSDTLQTLADSLDRQPRSARPVDAPSHSSGYLGVDDENFTVKPLENNAMHFSGEFSHFNFSMRIKEWIEQCIPEDGPNTPTNELTLLSSLPPRYISEFLIHAFFEQAETNYFYVERLWLMERLDLAYTNPSAFTRRDVGTACIIFIVLAIGTQYAYLDSRGEPSGERRKATTAGSSPFSEDAVGVMFFRQACQLIPEVIMVASLECVQACLLIGVYLLPLDTSGSSYIYLNLALRMAIQNGMHRKCPENALDPLTRETRNRVWWSTYVTEKRVSTFHGRPIAIAAADMDADMPVDRSDLWPLTPSAHYPHMLATLQLHVTLTKVTQDISILKASAKHEVAERLRTLADSISDLRRWWDELDDKVFQKEFNPLEPIYRPGAHLKLEYCLVRMFAGRPFIFPRESAKSTLSQSGSTPPNSGPRSSTTTSNTTPNKKANPRSTLVADCIDAALTVVDTLELLRSSTGLARASYTEFSSCRAALLVVITQCLQQRKNEDPRLRGALRTGLEMIKEMAAGGESARSEASLIEAFERAIARLDAADEDGGPGAAGSTASGGRELDYNCFKRWEHHLWRSNSSGSGEQIPALEGGGGFSGGVLTASSPGGGLMSLGPVQQDIGQTPLGTTSRQGALALGSPFFGLDTSFNAFASQPGNEFSSLFGFDDGAGSADLVGNGSDNLWTGT